MDFARFSSQTVFSTNAGLPGLVWCFDPLSQTAALSSSYVAVERV